MSFLHDKVACKGCKELYDHDLLNEKGDCKDCQFYEEEYLSELRAEARERRWNDMQDDDTNPLY